MRPALWLNSLRHLVQLDHDARVQSACRMAVKLDANTLQVVEHIKQRAASIRQKDKEWKHNGKWLRSGVVHYVDPAGKERLYETVERTTRTQHTNIDAVDLITMTPESSKEDRKICLVVVYRPPVDRFSVEFPSGLVDEGETIEKAAKRELAEETGYSGKIKFVGPEVYGDPWKSNENSVICIAEIISTEDRAELKLDDDEFLSPIELPLKDLRKQLELLQREHSFVINSRLYCFALGLEIQ